MTIGFLAFFLGVVIAVLWPRLDDTSKAAARREALLRHWIIIALSLATGLGLVILSYAVYYTAPLHSPWFRLSADVVTSIEQVPAALLGLTLGFFAARMLASPAGSGKPVVPGLILGAVGLLLVISLFVPADVLRSSLSRVETPILRLELQPMERMSRLPTGSQITVAGTDRAFSDSDIGKIAADSIRLLRDRTQQILLLSNYLVDDIQTSEFQLSIRKNRGYYDDHTRILFENILIPLADCAFVMRSASLSEDPGFLLDYDATQEIAKKLQAVIPPSPRSPTTVEASVDSEVLNKLIRHMEAVYDRLVDAERITRPAEYSPEGGKSESLSEQAEAFARISDSVAAKRAAAVTEEEEQAGEPVEAATISEGCRLDKIELAENSYMVSLLTYHFPIFVANMLAARSLERDAFDEITHWIEWFEKTQGDRSNPHWRAEHPWNAAFNDISILLSLNTATLYLHRPEDVTLKLHVLREFLNLFEELALDHKRLGQALDQITSPRNDPFSSDQSCDFMVEGKRTTQDEGDPREALQIFTSMYMLNLNTYIDLMWHNRDFFSINEMLEEAGPYLLRLRHYDTDCLPEPVRARYAVSIADTYLTLGSRRCRPIVPVASTVIGSGSKPATLRWFMIRSRGCGRTSSRRHARRNALPHVSHPREFKGPRSTTSSGGTPSMTSRRESTWRILPMCCGT